MILALDASTPVTTVALARGDDREVLAEVSTSGRGASEALLPAVQAALDLAGEEFDSVGLVLAGVGPGTFTGIRIAAATARALAAGAGVALARNSTLDALAAPALSCSSATAPCVIVKSSPDSVVYRRMAPRCSGSRRRGTSSPPISPP